MLVEGGGELHASFVEARLVDRVAVFVAPKLIGGAGGAHGGGRTRARRCPRPSASTRPRCAAVGDDWLIEGDVPSLRAPTCWARTRCSPGSSKRWATCSGLDGRRGSTVGGAARARGQRRSARASRSTAPASPWSSAGADRLGFDLGPETLAPHGARRAGRPATASTSSGPCGSAGSSGGHLVQGHVDGVGHGGGPRAGRQRRRGSGSSGRTLRWPALLIPQGSVAVDGVSLTVAALDAGALRDHADPAHARADDAGSAQAGAAREPRNGYDRQVRAAIPELWEDRPRERRDRSGLRGDRGGRRGDPRRPHARRGGRRGSRERGRPPDGRRQGDARGGQLHGQARARPDLHADDGRAPRSAPDLHDGLGQHGPARHRLHGERGRPARRDHGDLGVRSRGHHPHPRRPGRAPGRPDAARATSSRCARCPAACSAAPATPRRRSTWPGWPAARPPE